MSKFLSARYAGISPYVPGEQPQDKHYIKLNTNESPFPPSPKAVAAIDNNALESLKLYSDPEAAKSTSAIAAYYKLSANRVLVTNGSDEALAFCYTAFCDTSREIVAPEISYGFYPVFCQLLSLKYNFIPLKSDYKVDVDAFCGINKNIVIANPNAPTGIAIDVPDVERIVSSNPDNIVIIDEAYMDFGRSSSVCLLDKYSNLIIVGTLSKSRSLAGGRLGYILSSEDIIADIRKIKYMFNPYNVNRLTDLMGKYAFEDVEYFNDCVAQVIKNREYTVDALEKLGFEVLPSEANFVFARRDGICGKKVYERLKDRGILVRFFDKDRLRDFVRISIGSRNDMQSLISAVKDILQKENLL